ncbi:hypothetical protein [Thalassospira profundimaris]|uniref:hypothetical protein n=1 Tax=Thalassospira profundimaris TaxID=502049 RepID=UPI0015F0D4D4|nr:hypothetical protein [Thalassospira profundimaris]
MHIDNVFKIAGDHGTFANHVKNKQTKEQRIRTAACTLIRFFLNILAELFQILAKTIGGFTPRQRRPKRNHQQNSHNLTDPFFHLRYSPTWANARQLLPVATSEASASSRRHFNVPAKQRAKYNEIMASPTKICAGQHCDTFINNTDVHTDHPLPVKRYRAIM